MKEDCATRSPGSDVGFLNPEYRLRRAEAGELEFSNGQQPARTVKAEIAGSDDRAAELAGKLFQPRGEVHCRPDDGEVEPVAAADIAVKHLADVQCQAETDGVAAGVPSRCRHSGDALSRVKRGGKRAPAHRAGIGFRRDRENREQAVSHKFEHLAASLEDWRHLAIEITIEQ